MLKALDNLTQLLHFIFNSQMEVPPRNAYCLDRQMIEHWAMIIKNRLK